MPAHPATTPPGSRSISVRTLYRRLESLDSPQ